MTPITRKSMSKLIMQSRFRAVGQTHAELQTFEKPENKSTHAWLPYICLLFSGFSNVYHCACVWPTALKLGSITNFDMLFLVMGFIYLIDEIQFMLFYGAHVVVYRSDCRYLPYSIHFSEFMSLVS